MHRKFVNLLLVCSSVIKNLFLNIKTCIQCPLAGNNLNSFHKIKRKSKRVINIDQLGRTGSTNPKKKTSNWLCKLSKDWNLKKQWKKSKQDYACFKQSRMLVRQIETRRWCFSFWCRTPMLWTSKQSSTRTLEFQES